MPTSPGPPLRILVADDEAPARAKLRRLLAREPDVEIAGEAVSGPETVERIRALHPDVVLLDIQMPGLDGFGVLAALRRDELPHVVFVTAHDEHALKAFEVEALDYLLKPVSPERFRRVLARVRDRIRHPIDLLDRVERLIGVVRAAPEYFERLLVEDGDRRVYLALDRIDLLRAAGNYVEVHAGGRAFLLRSSMGTLEARLDPKRFVRINRSHIVPYDRVEELQPWFHGEYRVVLKDGSRLRWTRRYRAPRT